ncbi:Blo T chitinase allergen, putative [Ixodes scapularis]|uniref:Blo T chitinase allergen, putative n=1 Tax=Ixodes scapularis TaxID=6945 RepID=B7QN14_IXOSC|nr:Blo T chitinase allergen, putative [Ixodes scapularis]|eukprot:XP_002400504.1 Blo T chitinase allergen, putative [Ixodes scapularis]
METVSSESPTNTVIGIAPTTSALGSVTASGGAAPQPPPRSRLENPTSVMCVMTTLVVMFALVVLLQTRMTDNSSFHDLMLLKGVTARKRGGKFDILEADNSARGDSAATDHAADGSNGSQLGLAHGMLPRRIFDKKEAAAKDPVAQIVRDDSWSATTSTQASEYPAPRSMCMVHHNRDQPAGRRRTCNSTTLLATELPTELCTDLVYCCLGLDPLFNVSGSPEMLRFLGDLPPRTYSTRFWLALGDDDLSNGKFSVACRDEKSALMLAMNVLSLLKTYDLQGVFLYWTYPSVQESQLHVKLLRLMKELYRLTGKLVGTVVPFEQQLRERFDMPALVALLAPYSILVMPPVTASQQPSFSKTFSPFTPDLLFKYPRVLWETRDNVLRRDGRYHLCYMTSLAGWSFAMPINGTGNMALGPGRPFPGSNRAGRFSLDDVCHAGYDVVGDTKYGVTAVDGSLLMAYTDPKTYGRVLAALSNATLQAGCLGVWDLTWDDYCGSCGLGRFPLTGVLYSALFASDATSGVP